MANNINNDGYDAQSCNALQKPYYRPIEAALRWCNLIKNEIYILETVGINIFPDVGMFPQWPCLLANCEKIYDAIQNDDLRHGRDGKTVDADDHVAPHRLTVRHTDLKKWMEENYPDQKPAFLFDEIERSTHSKINTESFQALQADIAVRDARIEKAKEVYSEQKQTINALQMQLEEARRQGSMQSQQNQTQQLKANEVLGLMLEAYTTHATKGPQYRNGKSPNITKVLEDLELIMATAEINSNGLGKSTLHKLLSDAKSAWEHRKNKM